MRSSGLGAVGVVLVFLASGCLGAGAGSPAAGPGLGGVGGDESLFVAGIVVDEELVPLEGAAASIPDHDPVVTDSEGRFRIGPVEPGTYVVLVQKPGYGDASAPVSVVQGVVNPVRVTLKAIAGDVPYHETTQHVTFVICASYNVVGGVPCTKLVDYVAGTNISSTERFNFPFQIPNPGLVNMSIEMVWTPQAFGHDMLFFIQTPVGQPATALVVKYFSKSGGAPLQGWVTAGIKNRCGTGTCAGVFDAEPRKVTYDGLTVWSSTNSTIPTFSLYLNHRTETWMTMFYNRAGPAGFTALPDA